jgi:anti-sigma factor RsiW
MMSRLRVQAPPCSGGLSHSPQLRTIPCQAPAEAPGAIARRPEGTAWWIRLIQIALALYLIPALLVVLLVGGVGLLVLGAARLLAVVWRGPAGRPQTPVGPAPQGP